MARSLPEPSRRRSRYLRRQWKSNKSYLPRWESVPLLRLKPIDRPLFDCLACNSAYTAPLPICVWCKWTSPAAILDFEMFSRERRASAPPQPPSQQRRFQTTLAPTPSTLPPSQRPHITPTYLPFLSTHSSAAKHLNIASSSRVISRTAKYNDEARLSTSLDSRQRVASPYDVGLVVSDETVVFADDDGDVATATHRSPHSISLSRPSRWQERDTYNRLTASSHHFTVNSRGPASTDPSVDRTSTENIMNSMTKLSKKSSRSLKNPQLIVDLTHTHSSHSLSFRNGVPSSPSLIRPQPRAVQQKTLRRKNPMLGMRTSAPVESSSPAPSSPRPHSQPALHQAQAVSHCPPSMPITKFQRHGRSYSQPDVGRLGQPNRPYYSAIRPSMSRPNSVLGTHTSPSSETQFDGTTSRPSSVFLPPSRASSPVFFSPERPPSSLDHSDYRLDDEDEMSSMISPAPLSPPSTSVSSRTSTSGVRSSFSALSAASPWSASSKRVSLSGKEEVQMRMALARDVGRVSLDKDDLDGLKENRRLSAKMQVQVKKLSNGFKGWLRHPRL